MMPKEKLPDPNQPIGDRTLTIFEEGDILLCGLTQEQIASMTPAELDKLANLIADQSTLLLGS